MSEPSQITPGAAMGRQFGIADLRDRQRLGNNLVGMGFPDAMGPLGTGVGREQQKLDAVNQLAAEWDMEPFQKLEEVSEEFVDRLEAFLGIGQERSYGN